MARKVVKVVDKPAPKTAAKKNKKLPETEVWKLRSKRSELKNMLARMTFQRTRNRALTSLLQDPLMPQIETIALAADSRKAALINALRVQEWTEIADFMIVIEGNNKPQNMAIAGAIEVSPPSPLSYGHALTHNIGGYGEAAWVDADLQGGRGSQRMDFAGLRYPSPSLCTLPSC